MSAHDVFFVLWMVERNWGRAKSWTTGWDCLRCWAEYPGWIAESTASFWMFHCEYRESGVPTCSLIPSWL